MAAAVATEGQPAAASSPLRIFASITSSCLELSNSSSGTSSGATLRRSEPLACALIHSLHVLSTPSQPPPEPSHTSPSPSQPPSLSASSTTSTVTLYYRALWMS